MSIATLIMGESGTGKSTSMRNLDPAQTFLIQAVKKPLPFRSTGWKPVGVGGGNILVTDDSARIVKAMGKTVKPIIIIDDFQYIMANEFMRRVTDQEVGNQAFAKYNEIARNAWDIFTMAQALPDDKRVYILSHTETTESGKTKIKTIGKLLDEKIVLEGLVTIVLRTLRINDQYIFATQNSGSDTTKSPLGMFSEEHVENDLAEIDKAIIDYYDIQSPTKETKE